MTPAFRLATLLKLRQRQRDQAGQALAEVRFAITTLETQLQELDARNRSMDGIRKSSSHGKVELSRILDAQRYQITLTAQAAQLTQNRSLLLQELERRQKHLLKCQQSLRSLEKLQEHHALRNEEELRKREQHQLDEWSQTRFATTPETRS
jgi:flagellar protein FliJ